MKYAFSETIATDTANSKLSTQTASSMGSLDIFRLVAALLVVAIHTSPLSGFNIDADFFLTRILARVAVPFFLMVTGYFVLSDCIYTPYALQNIRFPYAKIQKYLKKTLLLYGISIVLYFPVGLYAGHFREISSISLINIWKILKLLLFDGTFYHLWYFPASIMGMLLLLGLRRFLSVHAVTVAVVILYIIGLLGDSYYGLLDSAPVLLKIYQFIFQISSYTRNGIFFAPLFLLLGAKIGAQQLSGNAESQQYPLSKQSKLLYLGYLTCFFVVSFFVMTLEAFTLHRLNLQRHDSMYLALIPVMYFLMKILLSFDDWICYNKTYAPSPKWSSTLEQNIHRSQNTNINTLDNHGQIAPKAKRKNSACLRPITTWIYILHPLMIIILRGVAKILNQTPLFVENRLIHYIGVCILTVLVSVGITYFRLFSRKHITNKFCIEERKRRFSTGYVQFPHSPACIIGQHVPCRKQNLTVRAYNKMENDDLSEHLSSNPLYQTSRGRAWIELDMAALRQNVLFLQSQLPPNCQFMPIVKANAYGHGAALITHELQNMGITAYGVATLQEGIELRQCNISGELLILGYTSPAQLLLLLQYQLTQTIVDYNYAMELAALMEEKQLTEKLHVHIGIDTGMHRLGERSEHIDKIIELFQINVFQIDGIFTHLATSDIMEPCGIAFQQQQKQEFSNVIAALEQQGIQCPPIHFLASYGTLNEKIPYEKNTSFCENQHCTDKQHNSHLRNSIDMYGSYARVGIALYGLLSRKQDSEQWQSHLHPVLSLKTRIVSVRSLYKGESAGYGLQFISDSNRTIATLAIGYADGLPRSLSNQNGFVLIHGCKAPIIGYICMDMTLVDVTNIPNVCAGEIVVIIGKSGEVECTASDIAECAGTITNDILSRLGGRLERTVSAF